MNFLEVTSMMIFEESKLKIGENKSSESTILSVCGNRKKNKGSKNKIIYWRCGQSGHVKRDCKNGRTNSTNSSKSHATNMVIFKEDDELSI